MNHQTKRGAKKEQTDPHNNRPPLLPACDRGKAQRINRIMSLAGLTSRREADEWIKSGRITINERLVTALGTRAVWGSDSIKVDGKEVPKPSPRLYLMLNKPFGYVCALKDSEGRRLVTELLDGITQRLYPVGRLDFDSLGLLLFTNDGQWTYRLTHPSYQIPRTYKTIVKGKIPNKAINLLKNGIRLEDGPSGPSKITLISSDGKRSIIRMTITQGRYRQVRRMLEAVGYEVIHLVRTGFGKLRLGNLKVGNYRFLKNEEVDAMKRMVGLM